MKTKATAILVAMVFLALTANAFGQTQINVFKITDVAKLEISIPAWVTNGRDHAEHVRKTQGATTAPQSCGDYLIAEPVLDGASHDTSTMQYFFGCGLPLNTWIVAASYYGSDPQPKVQTWQTTQALAAGGVVAFTLDSAASQGAPNGATFILTVAPVNALTRQLETVFGGTASFQAAYENVLPSTLDNPHRSIVLRGVSNGNVRALLGYVDISDNVVFATDDGGVTTATFDASNANVQQGIMQLLSVTQGGQGTYQTVAVFHPDCTNRRCSLAIVQPKPTPTITAVKNSGVGDQSVTAGSTNVRIGSYLASFASESRVTSIAARMSRDGIQNLRIIVNGIEYGASQSNVPVGSTITFSGSLTVTPGPPLAIDIYADILGSASPGTVTPATILASIAGVDTTTNSAISTSADVSGQSLTITSVVTPVTPTISVIKNPAFGNQTFPSGSASAHIGSYSVTSTTQIRIQSIAVTAAPSSLQNLHILVNGAQFGATQGTVTSGSITTFSGSITLPPNTVLTLDVYADIQSGFGGTFAPGTTLSQISAVDLASFNAIALAGPTAGQTLTIADVPPALIITADATTPSGDAIMGSTGNTVLALRLVNGSLTETTRLYQLTIQDKTDGNAGTFTNLRAVLPDGTFSTFSLLTTATGNTQYISTLTISVPPGSATTISIQGDVPSYASRNVQDNSSHVFSPVSGSGVGAISGKSANVAVSGSGGVIRVLRSNLSANATALAGKLSAGSGVAIVGTLTFSANPAGPVVLNKIVLTFTGTAITPGFVAKGNVALIDSNGIDLVASGVATMIADTNENVVEWLFNANAWAISPGLSSTFTLRVNSNGLTAGTFRAAIQNAADVLYTDGLDPSATSGLTLPLAAFPMTATSVIYQ